MGHRFWVPLQALAASLVQLSCRRYPPMLVSRTLPWRAARKMLGSLMLVGVRGGCSGSGGGLAGWAVEVRCVYLDVCLVFGGRCWSGRCRVVWSVRGGWSWGVTGACDAGVLWWVFFRGALVVSRRPVDGVWGRSRGVEKVSAPLANERHGKG